MNPEEGVPRLLVVADRPPAVRGVGGSHVVLERMLSGYPADRLRFLALDRFPAGLELSDRVRARLDLLPALPLQAGWKGRLGLRASHALHPWYVRRVAAACRRDRTQVVFACPFLHGFLFRAATVACSRLGIPLAACFMDDWAEWCRMAWKERAADALRWQAESVRQAAAVYVNGPGMAEEFERRYGVRSRIVTNVVSARTLEEGPPAPRVGGVPKIVYTGSVYGAQRDAIDRMVRALDLLDSDGVPCRLELHSRIRADRLSRLGWARGFVAACDWAHEEDLPRILREADLLLLPLSFDPEWAYTARTAAPAKLADYLASGRPVLVHAPPDADVSRLCRERGFGVVVDEPTPERLAKEIRRLLEDRELRDRLGSRAREVAAEHYDQRVAQRKLYAELSALVGRGLHSSNR